MEDREIVERLFARDEGALREVDAKYGRYCRAIAQRILGDSADAEECVNDAFLGVWRAIPPHRPERLSTFLGKLTRRAALKRRREKQAGKRGGDSVTLALEELEECIPDTGAESDFAGTGLADLLDGFLAALPAAERRVFLCRYWYLESVKEIAARFGFGESKVKMMLKRTREKLRVRLEKEGHLS